LEQRKGKGSSSITHKSKEKIMALKIIRATDAVKVSNLKVLIYGQPGLGKTSFGFTCPTPLCLDFDKGSFRSQQRKDYLEIETWSDVMELMNSPETLAPYQTVIIDTVGRCLDMITMHIINHNPKMGNSNGALSQKGWGELKSIFQAWMRRLSLLNKDVVMICHDKEDKDGDRVFKRPDVQGGSYAEVMKSADLIGYLGMRENKKMIDFNPCDEFVAKNAAQFKAEVLPDFNANGLNYGANLLSTAKKRLSSLSERVAEAAKVIEDWRIAIEGYSTPEQCTVALPQIIALSPEIAGQVKTLLNNRAKALGFGYNTDKKEFYKVQEASVA